MDPQIGKRLAIGLAALGLNMKEASLRAGFHAAYCRDVIRRNRGKFEQLEQLSDSLGLSWPWLKTGQGEMFASKALPLPQETEIGRFNEKDRALLRMILIQSYDLLGATALEAEALAGIVVRDFEARRVLGTKKDDPENCAQPSIQKSLAPPEPR